MTRHLNPEKIFLFLESVSMLLEYFVIHKTDFYSSFTFFYHLTLLILNLFYKNNQFRKYISEENLELV